jgi:hypothetical protein
VDNKKLFEFYREVDEVVSWLKERQIIAASDDYGVDIEHVQVMIRHFNFIPISVVHQCPSNACSTMHWIGHSLFM